MVAYRHASKLAVKGMNYDSMLELLKAKPFTPFDIITSAGQSHSVKHPEFVLLAKTRIVILDPVRDVVAVIPLLHVSEARFAATADA